VNQSIVVSVYFVIDSVRKLLDTPSYKAELIKTVKSSTGAVEAHVKPNELGNFSQYSD